MSLLHKLEGLYGGLTRLLTALLTVTLLVVSAVTLFNWQRATASEPPRKEATQPAPPKVASEDLIKRVIASQTGQSVDPISSSDPNRAAYDRIGKAIAAFAKKHPSEDGPTVEDVISFAREKVSYQDTADLRAAYATGLADTLERALADARIDALLPAPDAQKADAWASDATPMDITHALINQFDSDFTEQVAMVSYLHEDRDTLDRDKQANAWRSLMRLGGPLLMLMLLLQVLTFGRIEQNTRQLRAAK
jgi:hypothetical protein